MMFFQGLYWNFLFGSVFAEETFLYRNSNQYSEVSSETKEVELRHIMFSNPLPNNGFQYMVSEGSITQIQASSFLRKKFTQNLRWKIQPKKIFTAIFTHSRKKTAEFTQDMWTVRIHVRRVKPKKKRSWFHFTYLTFTLNVTTIQSSNFPLSVYSKWQS